MNDILEKREYLVGITIIEGRNIIGKDSQGTSDPFLKVRVADQVQQSQKKYEQNSAVWNQSLTFTGVHMNQYELETFELILELYDHNPIFMDEVIGQYSIGLSTLYRNLNHEFYKTWVGLFDPKEPTICTGYLLLSCFIVGPSERPPVHAADEEFDDNEMDSDEDEESIQRKLEQRKRAQGITVISNPSKIEKNYQLAVNCIKAEKLPMIDGNQPHPFVSCRVNGCVLTSKYVNNNQDPVFNTKIQFPVNYPILNDKITMRIWSNNGAFYANTFIANVPEHPCESDPFNLSKILAQDGRMPSRWFNLYGVDPAERSSRTKGKREGSCYLGRLLMGFNITPNERPALQAQSGAPGKEPKQSNFQLWVDLYEWINCELATERSNCWVVITQGPNETEPQLLTWKKSSLSYVFKKRQVDKLRSDFPSDFNQIPDIIINFYCNEGPAPTQRVGYLRMAAADVARKNPNPQWMRIKSMYNDTDGSKLGQALLNVQFLIYDPLGNIEIERKLKDKSGKQPFTFFCQILRGFELAPQIDEEKLDTIVEVQIGNVRDKFRSDPKKGRFPDYNFFKTAEVTLQKELQFETDMKVMVHNKTSSSKTFLGEFCVNIMSLQNRCDRPQYFNVFNQEGQFIGSLLCNFYLKFFIKDPKARKVKNYEDPEFLDIRDEFRRHIIENEEDGADHKRASVSFSVLGIRNLMRAYELPVVKCKLTTGKPEHSFEIKYDEVMVEQNLIKPTENPTFGQIHTFEDVMLSNEPLLWPFLQIEVDDTNSSRLKMFSQSKQLFTTISLLDFLDPKKSTLIEESQLRFALEQLKKNQDNLEFVQFQLEEKIFLHFRGVELHSERNANVSDDEEDTSALNGTAGGPRKTMALMDGQQVNQVGLGANQMRGTLDRRSLIDFNLFDILKKDVHDSDEEFFKVAARQAGGGLDNNMMFGSDEEDDEFGGQDKKKNVGAAQNRDLLSGIIIGHKKEDDIYVSKDDKRKEERDRSAKIKTNKQKLIAYERKLLELEEHQIEQKAIIQYKVMEVNEEIDDLNDQEMTEEKFWGMLADDDEEEFDYGRDVLKEGVYETYCKLPYKQIQLFYKADWYAQSAQPEFVQVGGLLRSGHVSEAYIKGHLSIREQKTDNGEEEEAERGSDDSDEDEDKGLVNNGEKKDKDEGGGSKKIWEQQLITLDAIYQEMPFVLNDKLFIDCLLKDQQEQFKVRVYIIQAQNLSAMSSVIDLKSQLAGMSAMCTANPYPELKVGDGQTRGMMIKYQQDRESAMDGDLNPNFLKIYELDAQLPEDWKLEVAIMDKRKVQDQLIGKTLIDLESRRHSDLIFLNRNACKIEQTKLNQSKNDAKDKKKKKKSPKEMQKQQEIYLQKQRAIRQCLDEIKQYASILVPIEFRELKHPQKSAAQGIIQMWTEIITADDARKINMSRINSVQKGKYEIRLIIWETREIPLVDGGTVDIFCKVTFDPTGWSEDEVVKETDTHMASKDGHGQFNWRMKFDLEVPCEFPRLKFGVFDAGMMADEAIGEATLSLKRTIKKLGNEDIVSVPKSFISVADPVNPDDEKGILMFSMEILAKEDAAQAPVGEAQEEPNINPTLRKPTAGRGLGDALSAMGAMPNLDLSWNPFGKFLYFVVAAGVMGTILTFAVLLK